MQSDARAKVVESTVVEHNYRGFDEALKALGVRIRYNVRWQRTEYFNIKGNNQWRARTKEIDSWLREQIPRRCLYLGKGDEPKPFTLGRDKYIGYAEALAFENEADPFEEWLSTCPDWDGVPRIDALIEALFNYLPEQQALVKWVSGFMFRGAVERTFRPGSKLDETPLLIGPQNIGKSTLLAHLLPPELPGLFGDGLNLMGDDKERTESIQGRVIVEAAEWVGARRADINSLKAFLTRTDDGVTRMAFQPNTVESPRRCVIVGTSNDEASLPNDMTGNRRFVAVELKAKNGVDVGTDT